MNRGKSKSREQSVCAGSSKPTASATEAVDDSEIPSEPESVDMVSASGETVTVPRVNDNLLNIVHSSFQARMDAKRSAYSFIALACRPQLSDLFFVLPTLPVAICVLGPSSLRNSTCCSDYVVLPCSGGAR